jgi:hypothetical protein
MSDKHNIVQNIVSYGVKQQSLTHSVLTRFKLWKPMWLCNQNITFYMNWHRCLIVNEETMFWTILCLSLIF